jgi:hypothetical protein
MMKKYILLGLLAFGLSLIAYLPASLGARLLPDHISGTDYQGSIWQGSASNFRINNLELGYLQWQLHASCLLAFKLCANVDQQHPRLNSSFDIQARSNIQIENLRANGDTAMIASIAQDLGIKPTGYFEADITKASFKDGVIESIEGNVDFNSLALNGVLRISMGDVQSTFVPQEDHTQISITNNDGHLDLSGVIQLYMDTSYDVDLRLTENRLTNQTITNGLKYLSERQNDGSYRIRQRGKW